MDDIVIYLKEDNLPDDREHAEQYMLLNDKQVSILLFTNFDYFHRISIFVGSIYTYRRQGR